MWRKTLLKTLGEGLLIVFSVLFALFINQRYEASQLRAQQRTALHSIQQELQRNQQILQHWEQRHQRIFQRLGQLVEGRSDSLRSRLASRPFLDLGLLTEEESLIDDVLSDTAWESARATGIVAEFDFETTEKLTQVYTMQQVLTDRTLQKILDLYFSAEAHDMEDLDATLLQFYLRFQELSGQEVLMGYLYKEALQKLQPDA